MFGLGFQEIVILVIVGTLGVGGFAILYFVVRAAVRAGIRDSKDSK